MRPVLFNIKVFPRVFPLSLLALNTGIKVPDWLVHHVMYTVLPDAAICAFSCSEHLILLS